MQDMEPFIELMAHVRRNMEHKEWLYLDPPDEVRKMLHNGTMSLWVAADNKRIVGAFDALKPKLAPFSPSLRRLIMAIPLALPKKSCCG